MLLARTVVELADNLVDDFDVVDLLTTLSDRCVEVLDVSAAGIMLVAPDGHLQVMCSSDENMRVVELFELQSQEGPCLECYHSGVPAGSADLDADHARWPRFAPVARAAGYRAAEAVPMRLRNQIVGALNLFHNETGTLSVDDVAIAQALADIATIAILQHNTAIETRVVNEQLTVALNSRIVIEQAKGVIAERSGVDVVRAFDLLRSYARSNSRRLAEVAAQIVDGTLRI